MRRVPGDKPHYTIIGSGRMATHFCHYLTLLGIPYRQWARRDDPTYHDLPEVIATSERLLVLISDDAIGAFITQHVLTQPVVPRYILHFSGCLNLPDVIGAHPLMTFGLQLYTLADYQQIPFMLDKTHTQPNLLLPGLMNPCYPISAQDKALYHAFCVLSGNFTVMLWQKVMTEFKSCWQVPESVLHPYLKQTMKNICDAPDTALTGPLARADMRTITQNIAALQDDAYQAVYQAFVQAFQSDPCHATHAKPTIIGEPK